MTGADLHESKGVAAATANKVYITDGAASGTWTATSTLNPFSNALLHVRDEKASGTAGGTFTSGDWRTRDLNTTKTNEITGASLASNQITLPTGTYYIQARAPGVGVSGSAQDCFWKAKLRNVTDGSDTLIGSGTGSVYGSLSSGAVVGGLDSFVEGRFTIASQKVFELQHRCSVTQATTGFGRACSFSVVEVYSEVLIWKL